jgi:hypothetical protein
MRAILLDHEDRRHQREHGRGRMPTQRQDADSNGCRGDDGERGRGWSGSGWSVSAVAQHTRHQRPQHRHGCHRRTEKDQAGAEQAASRPYRRGLVSLLQRIMRDVEDRVFARRP